MIKGQQGLYETFMLLDINDNCEIKKEQTKIAVNQLEGYSNVCP